MHKTDRGFNKLQQLTIERNGPCDQTMNGTLSIAKLTLAERMYGHGCLRTVKVEKILACKKNTTRSESLEKNFFFNLWEENSTFEATHIPA